MFNGRNGAVQPREGAEEAPRPSRPMAGHAGRETLPHATVWRAVVPGETLWWPGLFLVQRGSTNMDGECHLAGGGAESGECYRVPGTKARRGSGFVSSSWTRVYQSGGLPPGSSWIDYSDLAQMSSRGAR
ncbi:hypothetical protein EJ04DRAFT_149892 [Polyplosphaeria fusca]|uniref:Uncharacterized protein n=1 Tax=Polyplosphaeria fusca TaxID=682080 RepID=A0A9P4R4M8_9PLEO|nr:hypothetical protein EJ04DRAFT_149892 [Polyplosphaeria fusca]